MEKAVTSTAKSVCVLRSALARFLCALCMVSAVGWPGAVGAQTFLDTLFDDPSRGFEVKPWEGPPPPAWLPSTPPGGTPSADSTPSAEADVPAGTDEGFIEALPDMDINIASRPVAFPGGGPVVEPTVSLANANVLLPLWQNRPLGDFLVERTASNMSSAIGGVGVGYWERGIEGWRGPGLGLEGPMPLEVVDNMYRGLSHNSYVATPDLPSPFFAIERNGRMWRATIGEISAGPVPPNIMSDPAPVLPLQEGSQTLLGPGTDWVHLWRSPDGVVRALLLGAEGSRMAAVEIDTAAGRWVGDPRDLELLPGMWDGTGTPGARPEAVKGVEGNPSFDAVVRGFGWTMYPVWSNAKQVVWEVPTMMMVDGHDPLSPPERFWLLDLQEGWVVELDAQAWAAAYTQGRPDPQSIPYRP